MSTLPSIMADLKKKRTAQTRKTYSRHGMDPDRVLGVSIADLKVIAKSIKGQQALAQELYATGTMEAMYLACLVADGAKLSRKELKVWADAAAGLQTISEYSIPWVTASGKEKIPKRRSFDCAGRKRPHPASLSDTLLKNLS